MGSFSPQDQTRPDRGIQNEPLQVADGGSFADMPSASSEPLRQAGWSPEPGPEPEAPQQKPEEALGVAEREEEGRGVRAPDLEQAVFNALARASAQATEAQQQAQFAHQAARAWQPPTLPDDWEEVLSDPEKARKTFQQQHEYIVSALGALQRAVQVQQSELEGHRIREARRTWDEVRKDLIEDGVRDPDVYAGQIESIISNTRAQDPGFYWSVWTDKDKLLTTARMIRSQESPRSTASGRQSPRPASIGSSQSPPRGSRAQEIPNYPEIAKVERMLGRKLSADARRRFDEFKRRNG